MMSDIAIAKDDKLDTRNHSNAFVHIQKDQEESMDDENVLHNKVVEGNT